MLRWFENGQKGRSILEAKSKIWRKTESPRQYKCIFARWHICGRRLFSVRHDSHLGSITSETSDEKMFSKTPNMLYVALFCWFLYFCFICAHFSNLKPLHQLWFYSLRQNLMDLWRLACKGSVTMIKLWISRVEKIFHLQKISLLYVCIVCMRHLKSNNYAGYDCSLCSLVSTDHIFPGARENSSHKTQVTTTALHQARGCDS